MLIFSLAAITSANETNFDQCCSFPCQNGGVCMSKGSTDFTCDCTGLEYYGKTCDTPFLTRRIKNLLKPSLSTMHKLYTGYPWLWKIINNVPFLQRAAMRYVYLSRGAMVDSPPALNTGYDYITTESHFNQSYYARSLPPVPATCPTPMGVVGRSELPDIDVLAERFFRRRQFIPEPHGTNVFFAFYAQHFSHQFFRTDKAKGSGFTMGKDGVDVSHIYGLDMATQMALRSLKNGKMKVRVIDGEAFPPLLRDTPGVQMVYPPHVPQEERVALGHPFFSVLPGLYVMSTIWLREHNRICDLLAIEHPQWDDERLYHTTKLIVLAQNLKITIEEYVQHLSQYKVKLTFDPELLRDQNFQFSNRIHIEFNHLYHWHPLMPDQLTLDNTTYTMPEMTFSTRAINEHGFAKFVDAISTQPAGALNHHNHGPVVLDVFKQVVRQGRELRLQSFNNYRLKFGMPKYTSFMELTGDADMARQLEQLYGHIDALEFYPGLLLEKLDESVTPFTMVNIGGPYAVKGMMSNPIASPQYWKPSTFGGDVGFDIVKSASIERLFCQNMKPGECANVGFRLPSPRLFDSSIEVSMDSSPITDRPPAPAAPFSPSAGIATAAYDSLTVGNLKLIESMQACLSEPVQWSHRHQHCNPREATHF